jgi:rhodanese-related sulfurtransferase
VEAETSSDTETSVAPERVAELLDEGKIQVIDVRESSEWEAGHVGGATHIEFEQVAANADAIDKGTPVVFQCRGGSRSEMIAAAFRESGWESYNMDGGLRAWQERGLPIEPDGGHIEGA